MFSVWLLIHSSNMDGASKSQYYVRVKTKLLAFQLQANMMIKIWRLNSQKVMKITKKKFIVKQKYS